MAKLDNFNAVFSALGEVTLQAFADGASIFDVYAAHNTACQMARYKLAADFGLACMVQDEAEGAADDSDD